MQQLEFFDIPSPCIDICTSGKSGYCQGCFRSREERLHWHQLDVQTKRQIITACTRRKRRSQLALLKAEREQNVQLIKQQTELFD